MNFRELIEKLQAEGKLPTNLTAQQMSDLQRSFQKYCSEVSDRLLQDRMEQIRSVLHSVLNPQQVTREGSTQTVTEGFNQAMARNAIAEILNVSSSGALADKIDFAIRVATDVARGAGNFVREGMDKDVVDEYPAWELLRVYDRDVPRGFKLGPKGTLIPVPDDDWPSRWEAAGGELTDDGRMIALKSDPIWQALGDGEGGYEDTLGNPFPPFAFNSGFDVNNISRAECEELELLDPGEEAAPAPMKLSNLFAEVTS